MKRWPWWVWVATLGPIGLGCWAALMPGFSRRRPLWIALGMLPVVLVIGAFVVSEVEPVTSNWTGVLAIAGWIASAAVAMGLRQPYLDAGRKSAWSSGVERAEARIKEREEALALVAENPALALELGVGRPDVRRARHAGLVDVNHASAKAIAELPGFDAALAKRVVALREDVNGFTSLAEFGTTADIEALVVERLRDRAVFLPR